MKVKQRIVVLSAAVCLALPAHAQSQWSFSHRIELRANYRDSNEESFQLRVRPPELGGSAFLATPDPGGSAELSVAALQLEMSYGTWFAARARVHAVDKYRRNPTSTDRDIDAEELFIRFGEKPEVLNRPERTSFFVQIGKAPKMERQPVRLLESYGLAATAFNRFEDTQILVGGTVGRNLYWRLQGANGNPLFFRDSNALAGDNGTPPLLRGEPSKLGAGFPILYNAESESLFFDTGEVQFGQALGYRWQRDDGTFGFDFIAFHYDRDLADEAVLTGTFYGGDLDLLDGAFGFSLPTTGRKKEEYGGRAYVEWHGLTAIAQFTKQNTAGLQRQGHEIEAGYRIAFAGGLLQSIQPAARLSGLSPRYRAGMFLAPSVGWPWTKIDAGIRAGFARNIDVTVERARHNVGAPPGVKLDLTETLVTLRWRS
ncbi:MAG TPA: hypothetical protein VMS98_03010 [Thermoanaerobaculia bacterium]|nr:hypothetical protein [Thermoanaerobaculia bacterium]